MIKLLLGCAKLNTFALVKIMDALAIVLECTARIATLSGRICAVYHLAL